MPKNKNKKQADVLTPYLHNAYVDLADGERLAFWKQILPKKTVHYTAKDGSRQKIDFDTAYLTDLANNTAVDSLGFLLADKDNAHTMDPEKWRGKVEKLEVRDDGLYGKIVFPNKQSAQAVLMNPELGVSARIRESIAKSDGTVVPRGIVHVLGTLDPQVDGMKPWELADLSTATDDVLDLSTEEYDMATKTKKKSLDDYTEADVEAMSEDELDAFLAEFAPEVAANLGDDTDEDADDEDDSNDDDELDDEDEPLPQLAGAGADMSKAVKDQIDLANSQAQFALQQAAQARAELAAARWERERDSYLNEGVPPHLLDLATPVLARTDDMVIDLSNSGEDDVNVSTVVRGLLDAAKGTIDLSVESGHSGTFMSGDGNDPDAELLAQWDKQSR